MNDSLRALLYPFGFIASLPFGIRYIIQWYQSEKEGKSVTIPIFWQLSLLGNILMFAHSTIQIQFWVSLVQAHHGVLSWRNLNFYKPKEKQVSFYTVILLLILSTITTVVIFVLHGMYLNDGVIEWARSPQSFGEQYEPVNASPLMHFIGGVCVIAYSIRFWVQWLQSEWDLQSELTKTFWYLSILGAVFSALYFFWILDWVNAIGPMIALIPYTRNVFLYKNNARLDNLDLSNKKKYDVFLFAGETSADIYGSHIIDELKKKYTEQDISLWGVGGRTMCQEQAFTSICPFSTFQVMGFSDVLKKLPQLFTALRRISNSICARNPDAVLIIDSPSFSLRLAKKLRKKGYTGKIIQVVAPTVWAYKKERADYMGRYFDALFVLFPFEPAWFSHTPLKCVFIGHPMLEHIEQHLKTVAPQQSTSTTLAIFPGSRPAEIRRNFKKQMEAVIKLAKDLNNLTISISLSPSSDICWMKSIIENLEKANNISLDYTFENFEDRYSLMKRADVALAKSGTVTLELAIFGVPTVVVYELSWLNYFIAKHVIKLSIPYFCIVNILAEREVFKELIRPPVTQDMIYKELKEFFASHEKRERCKKQCRDVKNLLDTMKRPTEIIVEELSELIKKA